MTVPWWAKIAAKLLLARIPLAYSTWTRFGIFRHGGMAQADYAREVFAFHLAQFGTAVRPGAVCLEVGPGDSLFTAINAHRAGFARTFMVDAGNYARSSLDGFRKAALAQGVDPAEAASWRSLAQAIERLGAHYLTDGIGSLRAMPDASVDFIFSQAVLEHVRAAEYRDFIAETYRILAPGGVASHQIDLRDHLQAGLNNLRFGTDRWEAEWMAQSGFYTNRIAFSDHCRVFEECGFEVTIAGIAHFESLPLARASMAAEFRDRSEHDLMVSSFHLVARK